MFSSSGRAQTEPVAALLAILVVGAGLALYAGVLDDALDVDPRRDVASATLEHVEAHLTPTGVVDPTRFSTLAGATPEGYETNVTLAVDGAGWSVGPTPPPRASSASRTVSVRTAPVTVEAGILRVVTWT